jgi:hypothetical protein
MKFPLQQGREATRRFEDAVAKELAPLVEGIGAVLVGAAFVALVGFIVYIPIHFIVKYW